MSEDLKETLDAVYEAMERSQTALDYSERHGIASAAVLTVLDDNHALLIAERLRPRIEGKTVVEIGGGIGLLALHMGHVAKRVYCIEANPMWSWAFAEVLLRAKPRNVSFLFGAADEFLDAIRGDVAVFCTHSDVAGMGLVAAQFASTVIDVYGELIKEAPHHFDATAVALRGSA
jgi:predicted O-methyltransferase YrrM